MFDGSGGLGMSRSGLLQGLLSVSHEKITRPVHGLRGAWGRVLHPGNLVVLQRQPGNFRLGAPQMINAVTCKPKNKQRAKFQMTLCREAQ